MSTERNLAHTRARNDECATPNKVGYTKRKIAREALRRFKMRSATNDRPGYNLTVYRCECGLYHLGNRREGQRRDGTFAVPTQRVLGS